MTVTDQVSIVLLLFIISSAFLFSKLFGVKTVKQSNIKSLEGLRGIACSFVLINHIAYSVTHAGFNQMAIYEGGELYFGKFGAIGVGIFFCLTGYLFSRTIKSGNIDFRFFDKRIKRLAPAYLFISTIILLYCIVIYHSNIRGYHDLFSIIQQIYGFGFWGGYVKFNDVYTHSLNAVYWTLPYEWKFYAMVPFLACIFSKRAWLSIAAIFCMVTLSIDFWSSNVMWGYFIFGFISSYLKKSNNKIINLFCCATSLLILYYFYKIHVGGHDFISMIMIGSLFPLFIISQPKVFERDTFVFLGTISYSVYLSHQAISTSIITVIGKYIDISLIPMAWYYLLCSLIIIITFFISSIIYFKVELKYS